MIRFNSNFLVDRAIQKAGHADFGGDSWREGLDRLIDALNDTAQLTQDGANMMGYRIANLLINRLAIARTYEEYPEISEQVVQGPVFVIGLPRTGTTALSQQVAADPQMRSLRTWVSDRDDTPTIGGEPLAIWAEAIRRAIDFRDRVGDKRFADLPFADIQSNPVAAIKRAYGQLDIPFNERSHVAIQLWADGHKPGLHGKHESHLENFGLSSRQVHSAFVRYTRRCRRFLDHRVRAITQPRRLYRERTMVR